MSHKAGGLYIALLSIHGLIRWHNLELGRDADTGGQTLYVVELAQSLARHPGIGKVDLITQRVTDKNISSDYAEPVETLAENLRIIRIDAGPEENLAKEELWDNLDFFTDNLAGFFRDSNT